mgnify:FL=1
MKKLLFLLLISTVIAASSCGGGSKKTETPEDNQANYENQKALAIASFRRGNFKQALDEIDAAQKLNAEDAEVYLIKGAIYFKLKDYPLAADGYRKALEINPSYTAARFNLCGLYLAEKKYQEVITECEAVVADPAYDARANAYTNIGIAYFSLGDMVKAKDNYDKALQINPSFVYARNEMGKLYMSTGRYAQAATEFELAIAGYDAYEEAHYNLALAYMKVNNTQGACKEFAKVVELSPSSEFGINSTRYLNTVCN